MHAHGRLYGLRFGVKPPLVTLVSDVLAFNVATDVDEFQVSSGEEQLEKVAPVEAITLGAGLGRTHHGGENGAAFLYPGNNAD